MQHDIAHLAIPECPSTECGFFLPITTLPEILVVFKREAATLVYAAHWQFFCRAAGLPMNTDTPAAPYSLAIFIGRNHLLVSEVCL